MKIKEIAQRLNDCAAGNCRECNLNEFYDLSVCQNELIVRMADECRKIVEESEDDLK